MHRNRSTFSQQFCGIPYGIRAERPAKVLMCFFICIPLPSKKEFEKLKFSVPGMMLKMCDIKTQCDAVRK
jgi:hypothetical protein